MRVNPCARFWPKLRIGINPGECWLWIASRDRLGYGNFSLRPYRVTKAHRAMWLLCFGLIPDGLEVCHKCDNPPCVNPEHLFLGTHAENGLDMARKGRASTHNRKLKPSDVREVRALFGAGVKQAVLAARFGVSTSNISTIVTRRSWIRLDLETET